MSEKISHILKLCAKIAPFNHQENWDNSGPQILFDQETVTSILLATDLSLITLKEAIKKKANCIIVHHPPLFRPIKSIQSSDPHHKLFIEAIQNKISIIAMHTNLDACPIAMNQHVLHLLGVKQTHPLSTLKTNLKKLFVYVPINSTEKVRSALCLAGAGHIGNYSNCSFSTIGTGTFKPEANTNPYIGKIGKLESVEESKLEVVFESKKTNAILHALRSAHPYEEIAYDLMSLENETPGLGCYGELAKPLTPQAFAKLVKNALQIKDLRFSQRKEKIKRVGIITGGAGSLYHLALKNNCDAYISGDIKHNEWIEANQKNLLLVDATHYGTEKYFAPVMQKLLKANGSISKVICSKDEKTPYRT